MDELERIIDSIDDDVQLDGRKAKELLHEVVAFCKFELENKKKMYDFLIRIKDHEATKGR